MTNPKGLKFSGRSQTQRAEPGEAASVRCQEGLTPGQKAAECSGAGEGVALTAEPRGLSLGGVGNILGLAAIVA